ncbi:NAD(P)-dependent oxidoreductase [Nisaea sp.]|uniref:NAD-dependent epimerase/dehydratase family protein n=1 Tax=Nisaea sp. TaxID=2024842 RepID=UPI0032988CBD
MAVTKSVIVTGAGSFLGEYVLKALDAAEIDTIALSRQAVAACRRYGLSARVKPVDVDLSAPRLNWSLPLDRPHTIINLAFDRMVANSSAHGAEINERLTRNVLRLCRASKDSKIVNASSMSVYGKPEGGLVSEDTAPLFPSDYGIAKLQAEQLFADAPEVVSAVSIRLPALLGRDAHSENWLVRVAQSLIQNEDLTYSSPDFRFNNAVMASDVAMFFVGLAMRDTLPPDVRVPIGSAPGPCLADILEQMRSDLNSKSRLKILPSKTSSFGIDNSAAKKLGYRPRDVMETIKLFVQDFAQNA